METLVRNFHYKLELNTIYRRERIAGCEYEDYVIAIFFFIGNIQKSKYAESKYFLDMSHKVFLSKRRLCENEPVCVRPFISLME